MVSLQDAIGRAFEGLMAQRDECVFLVIEDKNTTMLLVVRLPGEDDVSGY